MRKLAFIALVSIFAGCSADTEAGSDDLSRNQQKWTAANVSHYRFSLNVYCFCPPRQMPWAVEVLDNNVVSAVGEDGVPIAETDPSYALFGQYATMDRLFTALSGGLSDAEEVSAEYDPTYGFPSKINVDYYKESVDDEFTVAASAFEPLP